MTDSDKSDNRRSETDHRALREMADRIAGGQAVGLSKDDELQLVRVVHELEQTRYALELAETEQTVKDEQLRLISRELEAAKSDFWAVAELIPAAFMVLDKKGIVEKANARARQMLVGDFKPIIGLAFSNFVAPEDLGTYLQQIKISRHPKKNASSFELRMRDHAGRLIHTYGQVSARFDAEEGMVRWNLAFFDVSEQKRLEEALRTNRQHLALATEAGKIGIWVYDMKTGKAQWNDRLYLMLGTEPREGPEEQETFFNFIHPEDRHGALQSIESLLKLGDTIDLEFRVIRADDGRIRWLAARGVIDRDEAGRVIRIRGVNFDISEHKQAEETLRLTQLRLAEQLAKAERINEELSQFAYAASHDLKAPLRAIRNYSDFLYDDLAGSLGDEQKAYLDGLKIAADQGQHLIEDLLAYSRIGRTAAEAERIDMPAMINEVKSYLNLPSDIDLTVQKDWPAIEADSMLLSQILKNLVTNAVKFNHSASKQVDIGWRQTDQNGFIELYVRDNGVGIDPRYQQQIFGIFQRLHTAKEYEGTGIGLAIVKKTAQEMGGTVRVESTPGEGSTFYVEIPSAENRGQMTEASGRRPEGRSDKKMISSSGEENYRVDQET